MYFAEHSCIAGDHCIESGMKYKKLNINNVSFSYINS